MQIIKEGTAADVLIGPFVDATDGVTPEAGLTLAQANILLSKNGQALAQKTDATTAVADGSLGYYNCELDATDTGTVGTLVLVVYDSEALPVRHEFMVMEADTFDLMYTDSTGLAGFAQLDAVGIVVTLNNTANAQINAKLDIIDPIVDAILVDTDTTIPGLITTVDTVVDAIKAVTDALPDAGALTTLQAGTTADGDIQSRLPAALVGAAMDSNVSAIQTDAITAAAIAADALVELAENLLKYDFDGITGEAARSMLNALRALRNKVTLTGTALSVKKEDDSTEAWAATATLAARNPVTEVTPS
jgi:hypothetical protein